MKNKNFLILILFLLLFSIKAEAGFVCSDKGFTVLTINGIFTDESEAIYNKVSLSKILPSSYNNQPVIVDYVHNQTHLGGLGDLVDVARQGLFDPKSDYDLVEMSDDASEKVRTQKLLLVGHSQGNFYANNFYDKVANVSGGVPSQSIGVYGVASPDKRVAGGGKYLTSDTDQVIAVIVSRLKTILKPNTHIELAKEDGNGHSFSDVYLKYRSREIISDIKNSLDKLQSNSVQDVNSKCIAPQKISALHKATGVFLAVEDLTIGNAIQNTSLALNNLNSTAKSLANTFLNLGKRGLALVGLYDSNNSNNEPVVSAAEDVIPDNTINEPTVTPTEKISTNNNLNPVNSLPEENPSPENIILQEEGEQTSSGGGYVSGGASPGVKENTPEVTPDTTPPVITLNGESILNINLNSEYLELGAIATDNVDATVAVTQIGDVDISKLGTYLITYSAIDSSSNKAIDVTRTVNVIENIPVVNKTPVVSLIGQSEMVIEWNSEYKEEGATALDEENGILPVEIYGRVDVSNVGEYIISYKATDKASNVGVIERKIKVVNSFPTVSSFMNISIPIVGVYANDGLNPNSGRKNVTSFVSQIIYTDSNNNPPQTITMHIKNKTTGIYLDDVLLNKIDDSSDILSDGNYSNGEIYTASNSYDTGEYLYSFTAFDKNGNFSNIEEKDSLKFSVVNSTYTYVTKYTFGTENGDGNDWQVWSFNGSNVYDWNNIYLDKYLREQFKIQVYEGPFYCTNCLERGIFNHDPQKGFEASDLNLSSLEHSPQNSINKATYDVVIQWDSRGYTYNIFHGDILDYSGHIDVPGAVNNLWVGWDSSEYGFRQFPSGSWTGIVYKSPDGRTGGSSMIMKPYPVYDQNALDGVPVVVPNPPAPKLSSEKNINSFSFEALSPKVNGIIDNNNHTISLTVPYNIDVKNLVPKITLSDKATVTPSTLVAQDFTNSVAYTVKAEDNSSQVYNVSVVVEPNPNDNALPTITDYSLNGSKGDVELNPVIAPLNISLTANKNVDWVSLKIERVDDNTFYREFRPDSEACADGSSSCLIPWDGKLSPEGRAPVDGIFKIKVHIRDSAGKEWWDYLPSMIIVIGQSQ